ncbi:MAG: hypothetical protein WA323_14685 [Candidatus Nitrosopolaris sp.]
MKRPLLQSIIFYQREGGYSSKSTRIYTDLIFRFADTVKMEGRARSREIKDYEIANWLLDNNVDFKNYYKDDLSHIRKATRVKNTIRKIQSKVDDLIRLGLMRKAGETKQSKGTGMVYLFQFVPFTYLLLANVRSCSPEPEQSAYWIEQAYNIYQETLTADNAPTINVYCARLYKKLLEHGIFVEYVLDPINEALMSDKVIKHVKELFYIVKTTSDDAEKVKLYHSLRNDALKELEPDARQRVLLLLKQDIEHNIVSRAHSLRDYEEILLRSKESPRTLAVEGYCEQCKTYVAAVVNTMDNWPDWQSMILK